MPRRCSKLKRFSESLQAYEASSSYAPAWSEPHFGKSKVLYVLDRDFDAAVELLISIRLDPARLKQYEMEFPLLRGNAEYETFDIQIRANLSALTEE